MNSNTGKRRSKFLVTFFAVFTLIAGLLIPTQIKAASYDKNQKGSIKINLNDVKVNGKVTNKKGVAVNIYQVAVANHDGVNLSFEIANSLESTGVNVNDITTSEKNLNAAKKLSAAIDKSGIKAITKKTDADGVVGFKDLPQGMYLVEEVDGASYGTFSPFLVSIPYMEDGQNWIYDVETHTKGSSNEQGSLEVTKDLVYIDSETGKQYHLQAPDSYEENGKTVPGARYYVGLFCDEDGMIPYGKDYVKSLDFSGSTSATVKYDNLPDGTYYLFETDENGTPYAMNKAHTDQYKRTYKCVVKGTSDNKIQFQGHPQKNMNISNVFAEVPDKFLIVGELSIKKRVFDENGQETTTNDTFYASVYTQNGSEDNIERELIQTVQLQQNDTVTISVPINQDASKPTNIYVEETDAEGNTIDPDNFDYTISGEGNVELSMDVTEGSITLTNRIKGEESSEEETTSTEKETTKKSKKSKNGKTGDTTPIIKWIIIGAVAAVVIIFLVGRKKKSE